MRPELAFGVVVIVLLVLAALKVAFRGPAPRSQHFKCARCGTLTTHSERTIEAWRHKRSKFYCQSCHAHWLASRPAGANGRSASFNPLRSGGCFGVALLFVLVPVVAAYIWAYA
jgi:hypothetical protein